MPKFARSAFDAGRNSFVQYYGANSEDAALLMLPLVGFLPCDDLRIGGTVKAIEEHLMEDAFLRRYPETEQCRRIAERRRGFFGVQLLVCSSHSRCRVEKKRLGNTSRNCSNWPTTFACRLKNTIRSCSDLSAIFPRRFRTSA